MNVISLLTSTKITFQIDVFVETINEWFPNNQRLFILLIDEPNGSMILNLNEIVIWNQQSNVNIDSSWICAHCCKLK